MYVSDLYIEGEINIEDDGGIDWSKRRFVSGGI